MNTVTASAKSTPCFKRFAAALVRSHSYSTIVCTRVHSRKRKSGSRVTASRDAGSRTWKLSQKNATSVLQVLTLQNRQELRRLPARIALRPCGMPVPPRGFRLRPWEGPAPPFGFSLLPFGRATSALAGAARPSKGWGAPLLGPGSPSEGLERPWRGPARPSEGGSSPGEGRKRPRRGGASPRRGGVPPSRGPNHNREGHYRPSRGDARPQGFSRHTAKVSAAAKVTQRR